METTRTNVVAEMGRIGTAVEISTKIIKMVIITIMVIIAVVVIIIEMVKAVVMVKMAAEMAVVGGTRILTNPGETVPIGAMVKIGKVNKYCYITNVT